jgi:hypothetical protein
MSVYHIEVPPCNSIDALAEQRERRDQRTRARMSKKAFLDDILTRLMDEMLDKYSALGELADMLFDAPIRDRYDFNAFLSMRDGRRVGKAMMTLVAEASLDAYTEADADEGF